MTRTEERVGRNFTRLAPRASRQGRAPARDSPRRGLARSRLDGPGRSLPPAARGGVHAGEAEALRRAPAPGLCAGPLRRASVRLRRRPAMRSTASRGPPSPRLRVTLAHSAVI